MVDFRLHANSSQEAPIQRVIEWFNKRSERLAGEVPLDLPPDGLEGILPPDPEDPFHCAGCFPLQKAQLLALGKFAVIPFKPNLSKFAYFISTFSSRHGEKDPTGRWFLPTRDLAGFPDAQPVRPRVRRPAKK